MSKMIELKNVTKKYTTGERDFYALAGVDLEIEAGELVVILGPSGAGKSTLLNFIGGMDSVSSGEIIFDGKDISKFSDKELTAYRAENVGFVFQFYNLIPTLTAYENVALMKDIEKNSLDPAEVLESVGLGDHLDQFPAQMSGGEQQRTSIARALCKNPKLLLCDEPTGALDTNTGKEILVLLQKMSKEEKRTVIIVTHNESFAEMADKVIKVKNGKIKDIIHNETPKNAEEMVL
jgi:putative ABC transport system ATP-binding protein